ncbi:MAG: endonuclease MutS2 [Bacteroidales bacterium]|nr:endonuclease MutS2 [Bacteroidales bacterium]
MSVELKIGFDKIKTKLNSFFQGELGRSRLESISLFFDVKEIERELNYVSEFKKIIETEEFPGGSFHDIREVLKKVKLENSYLVVEEVVLLWHTISTIQDIISFFKNEDTREKYPNLFEKSKEVKYYPMVIDNIKRILSKEGKIKDSASNELKRIRTELRSKESQVSGIVHKSLAEVEKSGFLEEGSGVVIRNGKMLIPVLASHKNKIGGIVQDYSASGKTVYIEPFKSVEINNKIRDLIFEEKREIIKILVEFTDTLRPYTEDLVGGYDFLAQIDFIRAKALLAIELNAEQPEITNNQSISLRNAHHPLLLLSYKKSKRKVVPLDLEINDNQRIILISGPNAGGKSIALKTVVLLQYMLQCGFLVPVKNTSKFGVFNDFFVDIGDDQSLESDLSTYSSHLLNMKNIVENSNEKSLILIDEFGSGTDPAMGGAIAEAILEELLAKNVKAVINTHYSNLKYFAAQNTGISNAAMLFDKENLKPLYFLEIGNPGSSFAFEIAQNIGLPNKIIQRAKDKTGKEAVDFDKIISEIDVQSRKIRQERKELNYIKTDLVQKVEAYRLEKEKLVADRKKILSETSNEAKEILLNANKAIEKTISEIKSKNAEKEATRKIRKDFEKTKDEIIEKVKNEELKVKNEQNQLEKKKKQREKTKKTDNIIRIGDFVRHKKQGIKGKIEEIKDGMAMMTVGNLRTFIKLTELEKIDDKPENKAKIKVNVQMETVERESFVFGIDVRGKRADEALDKISRYLDNAIIANASDLRILHGTGNGILRQLIRQYLKSLDYIEWFGDADVRLGGQGITLVKLKN